MKKNAAIIVLLLSLLSLVGCAPTLPSKSAIQESYSIADVDTFSYVLNCENTKVVEVKPDFVKGYCQVLDGNINLALQKELSTIKHDEKNPKLVVRATLEEINGGNAAARFLVGFGAGRSITTVYIKVEKNGAVIAEKRITETTTMPNIITNNFANDDAILQDAPLVARRIGEFVKDPVFFEKNRMVDTK